MLAARLCPAPLSGRALLRVQRRRSTAVMAAAGTKKEVVASDKAPSAVGPYSQAIKSNGMLYMSGSVGLVPSTMKLAGDGVEEQAEQVMRNMEAILAAAGCTFDDVVKTTVLLTDIKDFAAVNQIYGRRFPSSPPARSTFAVSALPLGAKVEIEAIAALR